MVLKFLAPTITLYTISIGVGYLISKFIFKTSWYKIDILLSAWFPLSFYVLLWVEFLLVDSVSLLESVYDIIWLIDITYPVLDPFEAIPFLLVEMSLMTIVLFTLFSFGVLLFFKRKASEPKTHKVLVYVIITMICSYALGTLLV